MTRGGQDSELKQLSVYATDEEKRIIDKLAALENRSVSNLLKTLALREARAKGLLDKDFLDK